MAAYPHEETPLTEHEKAAYRYLLFCAMICIRSCCSSVETRSPVKLWRQYQYSRIAGSLANWLHNLGRYSMGDFRGFSMERFWQDYERQRQRFPQSGPYSFPDFRGMYDEHLARLKKEQKSA